MPTWEDPSYRVGKASGMVSVQADCSVDEALVLMQERAQVSHQTLSEIADDVLARRIRFGV